MKNLIAPALLGAVGLSLLFAEPAAAQGSFNSSSLPNSNPFRSAYGNPSNVVPAPAPQATAPGGVPIAPAYNGGAYDMSRSGFGGLMTAEAIDPNHKLGPRDRLSYRVREDRDTIQPPSILVQDSGEVDVPLIGRVKAAGKTTQQLASDIKAQLEREYYKPGHATVIMGLEAAAPRISKGRVYVRGAVRSEGAVELPVDEELTVSKAIARSGGFKDFADQGKITVRRGNGSSEGITVNIKNVNRGKEKDVVLQPGDEVLILEKRFGL